MNKIKAIVIEDNTKEREKLVASIKNDSSFELLGDTADGMKGYEMIMDKKPDIVILDLILPTLDGIGIMEHIEKNYKEKQKPKFIVYSSISDSIVQQCVNRVGATYFIIKPCEEQLIIHRIKQLSQCYHENQTIKKENRLEKNFNIISMEEKTDEKRNAHIGSILLDLGLKKHRKSFIYIKEAITLCMEDMSLLDGVTKVLYPKIAYKFDTNGSCVERAIRYGITNIWIEENRNILEQIFAYKVDICNRPCNVEFIAVIADKFRQENNKE